MIDEKDPQTCYEILSSNPSALLVDCRAQIEWEFVGTPDLSAIGKKPLLVEWTNSAHQRNPHFLDSIKSFAAPDTPIIIPLGTHYQKPTSLFLKTKSLPFWPFMTLKDNL